MIKIRFYLKLILINLFVSLTNLQAESLINDKWTVNINNAGWIETYIHNNDTIPFSKHNKVGPVFYVANPRNDIFSNVIYDENIGQWEKKAPFTFRSVVNDIMCDLEYKSINGQLALKVKLTNIGNTIIQPQKAGIKLGLDTYMDKYPDWLNAYFPTLLRSEETHFWGYMMSPKNKIIAISSPDPIASWSIDYNYEYKNNEKEVFFAGRHRVEGINIDLLNALPLPKHCPQNLYQLYPNESHSWTIYITPLKHIKELSEVIAKNTNSAVWQIEQTSMSINETIKLKLFSIDKPIITYNGNLLDVHKSSNNEWFVNFSSPKTGHYKIKAEVNNKISEAIITVRHPWEWYIDKAREEAERCPQKASTHVESWYGFSSAFIAAKNIPNTEIDKRHVKRFDYLYSLLHKNDIPQVATFRVQNTSGTIDLLVYKYKAYKNPEDLLKASKLADWLIKYSQREDGGFRSKLSLDKKDPKGTIYTSVIYMAKSILDLALQEKELSNNDKKWKQRYERHYQSAKKAIEHLISLQGDVETEGEMTYEDGMISCTALQIAYMALNEENQKDKEKYTLEALKLLKGHDCLTQLYIPDGRQRGGTLRFWESQYDVLMVPNFMNSPHGWSAWRGFATYYMYLLTGEERWLIESYNAAGAFAELIDTNTGTLRWSFCANPYLPVRMVAEPHPTASIDSITYNHLHTIRCKTNKMIIGEQYINMISNTMFYNTQDNDVHEVFRFINESFLNNAFLIEKEDGSLKGYNCNYIKEGNNIYVYPNENLINKIHVNTKKYKNIFIVSKGKIYKSKTSFGWTEITN